MVLWPVSGEHRSYEAVSLTGRFGRVAAMQGGGLVAFLATVVIHLLYASSRQIANSNVAPIAAFHRFLKKAGNGLSSYLGHAA